MSKPTHDFIEGERLRALAAYDILDTAPETEFDDISRMAAMICGTSMSAVTLVDEYRQWFKASVGLPVRQTPRDIAFCHHVVERREDLIVPDASLSPVFSDNPLVTGEPRIRFYAGTPLLSEEGLVVGSICVIDHAPRELQPEQLEALHILARQASGLLSQRLRQRELLKRTAEAMDREAQVKRLSSEQEALLETLSMSESRLVREVTESVAVTNRLALYERAIEAANTGILITDARLPDHPIIYVNEAFQRITGYFKEEILGKNCRFLQGEGTDRVRVAALREAIAQCRPFQIELENYRKDGAQFCNHLYVSPVFDANGELTNYVGIQNDVTTLKCAEQSAASRALQQEALAEFGLFVLSGPSIHEINEEAIHCVIQTLHVNYAKYLTALPHTEDFIIKAGSSENIDFYAGKTLSGSAGTYARFAFDSDESVIVDDFNDNHPFALNGRMKGLGVVSAMSAAVRSRHQKHGNLMVFSTVKSRFNPGDVAFLQGIANILATALERAESERQLSYLAHHDGLTGLPNRLMLEDRLAHAIEMAERSGNSLALMFIDLNRFKVINDSLGHYVGDELLKAVADRLRNCLRHGDTLSRQGGDEYMLLMENAVDARTASVAAEKILNALQTPFLLMDKTFHISASIGIALYPNDAREPAELQRLADAAMYRAKELQAGGAYQFFTPEINALTKDRWELEHGLRNAISSNEMRLVYQPKLDLRTGKVTGFEALLRWQHSLAGNISPARFIPVAESTGLILMLGDWVLREACRQMVQWRSLGHEITVGVNVSARQFHQNDFVSSIVAILAQTGCCAEWIDIEITETGIMRDAEKVVEQLHALKRLGISISIDDFGTGYSSLSYLKRFDVDVLKIDQSLIRDITTDEDSKAITSSIIALAHSLALLVVAEGVETEEQRSTLAGWDCDIVQGYLIGHPMEPEACTNILLKQN